MKISMDGSTTSPLGFTAVSHAAGIKKENQLDLAIVASEHDCACAAVFTTSQVVAAPVIVDRETVANNPNGIRVVVTNSKNANACTGEPGLANSRATQAITAEALGITPNQVLVMSTGVIGVQLPMDKLEAGIITAVQNLQRGDTTEGRAAAQRKAGLIAAEAIMTTDTVPKHTAVSVELSGGTVTIGGMAKGSGMIHPNMATMLSVITTDVQIEAEQLQGMLNTAVNLSFNRISIDGDTSTNDTVLLLANGASGVNVTDEADAQLFQEALNELCTILSKKIVKDGEGATKFVEIQVTGTHSDADAHQIANTIAISPLVKTAFAGSDANWGRLVMAAGRAGVSFNQAEMNLWIGIEKVTELQLLAHGTPTAYLEEDAAHIFAQEEFMLRLQVGQGNGKATVWTCDMTHDYISINADYRT